MVTNQTFLASITAVAAAFLIGYAIYFDSKRKKDKELRKRIKHEKTQETLKQKKRSSKVENSQKSNKNKSSTSLSTTSTIIEMIPEMSISIEDIYSMPSAERERIFYSLLVKGEELLSFKNEEPNISNSYTDAAVQLFFKAIKMLPNPTELLLSLQQVLPKNVFNALTTLITEDGLKRIVAYFSSIIPKGSPITISPKKLVLANGELEQTWAIFATKDIDAGTVLYEEKPDAASLFLEHSSSDKYCDYCFKILDPDIVPCDECKLTVYCSKECRSFAQLSYHTILCCNGSLVKLFEISNSEHTEYALLVARYLSVLCIEEKKHRKENESSKSLSHEKDPASSHFEYMKPLLLPILPSDEKIASVLKKIFSNISPDIVEHLNDQRYSSIKGTLLFNSIGIPMFNEPKQTISQASLEVESLIEDLSSMSSISCDYKENSIGQCNITSSTKSAENTIDKRTSDSGTSNTEEPICSTNNSDMIKMNEEDDDESWTDQPISTSSPVIFESPIVESIESASMIDEDESKSPSTLVDKDDDNSSKNNTASSISINELIERTRSSFPKSMLIGHGIYHLSAHLQHSCDPNVKLTFPQQNNVLTIVTSRRIEKGDEVCMSYIPLLSGMTSNARRISLKSAYHIDCTCMLCEAELPLA